MAGIWVNPATYVELAGENSDNIKPVLEELAISSAHPTMQVTDTILPNPDPILREAGIRLDVFDSIESDPQVTTVIENFRNDVTGQQWDLEQGEAPEPVYQFVRMVYDNLEMHDINDSMLTFRDYGYQVMERNWIQDGSYYIMQDFEAVEHAFFEFTPDGKLLFCTKENPKGVLADEVYPHKFVALRNRPTKKRPHGKALLSSVFWEVTRKRNTDKWWDLLLQKFGIPKTIIKHPAGMEKTKVREMVLTAAATILDAVVAVPEGSNVDFAETNVTGSGDAHSNRIQMIDGYITKVFMGHNAGSDSTAGRLGDEKFGEKVYKARIRGASTALENAHNKNIRAIVDINFGKDKPAPKFRIYADENTDLVALADMHSKVWAMGFDINPNRLEKDLGYDDGDLTPRAAAQISAQPAVALAAGEATDVRTALMEQAPDMQGQAQQLLKPILKAAKDAKNFEQLTEALLASMDDDSVDGMREALARHLLFSNAAGRIESSLTIGGE